MRIFSLLLLFALVSPMAAFEVSPMNPNQGDAVTIRGVASPGEEVRLRSSFEMDIPVVNGKYDYVATGVQIPQRPNRLSVAANNVDDLKVGVRMGIWVTMPVRASGGVASVSKSDVPPGRYTLKIFGEALPGATTVSVRVDAETAVRAGSDGSYQMVMDTSGVPEGKYNIRAGGDEKVVMIGRSPVGASRYASEPTETGTTSPRRAQESPERGRLEDAGRPTPIPEPYYREMKRGDSENPEDLVRYFNAARNRAENLDVFEKAAFYEHHLSGSGFNVSFAYSKSFDGSSQDHLWLLMMTKKGEEIDLDPSYSVKGASSLTPLEPRYSRYDHRFEDIYEAAETLGAERLAWWTDETAGGSMLMEASLKGEEVVRGQDEPVGEKGVGEKGVGEKGVEEKGFIGWIRDLFSRALAKIGLALASWAGWD